MSAVLRISDVCERFDVALVGAGFVRSAYLWDSFGRDADQLQAGAFAVGAPSSQFDAFDGRDRYGTEGEAATAIGVKLANRIGTDDPRGTYYRALDEEARAIQACLDADTSMMRVRLEGAERSTTSDGGYLVSDLRLLVHHRYDFGRAP